MATKTITVTQEAGGYDYSFTNDTGTLVNCALTIGPAPTIRDEVIAVLPNSSTEIIKEGITYTLWAQILRESSEIVWGQVESAPGTRLGADWVKVGIMYQGNSAFFYL